jgi:hypothetical protein
MPVHECPQNWQNAGLPIDQSAVAVKADRGYTRKVHETEGKGKTE